MTDRHIKNDLPFARPRVAAHRFARGGFTFIEVLFAIMILGIGMIMVAAVFPVGIRQTQANVEDSAAMALVSTMGNQMQRLAQEQLPNPLPTGWPNNTYNCKYTLDYFLRPTDASVAGHPIVYSLHDPRGTAATPDRSRLWNWLRGNMVAGADPTYAYAVLWSRSKAVSPSSGTGGVTDVYFGQPEVTLYVAPMRARGSTAFSVANDTAINGTAGTASANDYTTRLDPVLCNVDITLTSSALTSNVKLNSIYRCSKTGGANVALNPGNVLRLSPIEDGAFLVLSDVTSAVATPSGTLTPAAFNGMIYRIGTRATTNDEFNWTLATDPSANGSFPGGTSTVKLTGAKAFVVGRAPTNRNATTLNRSGPPQEILVSRVPISLY